MADDPNNEADNSNEQDRIKRNIQLQSRLREIERAKKINLASQTPDGRKVLDRIYEDLSQLLAVSEIVSGSVPSKPRLELDEGRKRIRIDDSWHDYSGEKATYLLAMLLKARGQWVTGEKLEDPSIVIPRPDKIINRLPKAIKNLIESRKGGPLSGGYRIKPEYFE